MLIGYARVSTQEQNTELQVDALERAGCDRLYVEKASGAQRDRPELKAALTSASAGDTIVVWKLDRVARSLSQLIATFDDLERRGIGLRSLTEAIDTTTSGGKLVFHIFGALAEFERSIIRERTMAGLLAARARGEARRAAEGAERFGHRRGEGAAAGRDADGQRCRGAAWGDGIDPVPLSPGRSIGSP